MVGIVALGWLTGQVSNVDAKFDFTFWSGPSTSCASLRCAHKYQAREFVPTDANQIEVVIPAVDGTIQWQDVATAVADELKLDPKSVQQLMPPGQLDLHSDTVLLAIMGINLAAGDAISFSLTRDDQNRSSLCVRCNRKTVRQRRNPAGDGHEAGISLDDDWRRAVKGSTAGDFYSRIAKS